MTDAPSQVAIEATRLALRRGHSKRRNTHRGCRYSPQRRGCRDDSGTGTARCPEPSKNPPTGAGHWKGGIIIGKIIGKRTRPVCVLQERKSRVIFATRVTGKTAAETIPAMPAVFARIEPALRKSITFANDPAFARHA
jgi:IS30 family transposase